GVGHRRRRRRGRAGRRPRRVRPAADRRTARRCPRAGAGGAGRMTLELVLSRARAAAQPQITGQVVGAMGLTLSVDGVVAAFGVRALDTLVPCGKGQRLGIFAGSGVGKSTLLSQITRGTSADVRVIGLIGERGREVREFIEENLGEEGMARTVVVVATSDEPP